jgi:hypothetical protein
MEDDIALLFSTDDWSVDNLVSELVSPNVSHEQLEAILKKLEPLELSVLQKKSNS